MNFTNYRDEVIKFLESEADECCDFLDLRSERSKRVDRLKYYRKLVFLKDILIDSEMIDRVLKVEIVSSIADAADYLASIPKESLKNTKSVTLPFGMFSPINVSIYDLADYDFDSEMFRRKMFAKFGFEFHSLDKILEAKDFGYDELQYQSGVRVDHLGKISYNKMSHPYFIDKSFITDQLKVPVCKKIDKKYYK